MKEILIVIVGAVFLIFCIVLLAYNGLVRKRNAVANGWAYIQTELKRRHDLIPNLVETVKGYAEHEQSTLDRVIAARNAATSAEARPASVGSAEAGLVGALNGLFALREAYPELKASEQFLSLQEQLAETEDRIAVARRIYNANVRDYLNALQTAPSMWIAGLGTFPPAEFFQATESESAPITIGADTLSPPPKA